VFNLDFHQANPVPVLFNFALALLHKIRGILFDQGFERRLAFTVFRQDARPAKYDDAAKMGGESWLDNFILIDDAKRNLVIPGDAIQFVPCLGAMEKQFVVLISVTKRHGIRITIIAANAQNARGVRFQYLYSFGFR
jgi:hypothetical protein